MEKDKRIKYVIVVGDGMADYPVDGLHGKTPLMVAETPYLDWMASHGIVGRVRTVPKGFNPGSEIANLSIFGYDPVRYYTGRGPLEAASLGVRLRPHDLAFRCNLVTLRNHNNQILMEDFSAGHIKDHEANQIISTLNHEIGTEEIQFYAGVSYRHLMVLRDGALAFPELEKSEFTPPHDIIGQDVSPFLPHRDHLILTLMEKSQSLLKNHPVNLDRQSKGLLPANSIWLWGQGRSPQMVTLKERFGIEGYVISAVHLIKGIGIYAGLEVLEVPGITGYFDTNYEGKAQYALRSLKEKDFVYVHVEAPDEAGHMGDLNLKVEAIEAFDQRVVGNLLRGIREFERFKILVLPDHPTPLSLRTHVDDPVPFLIYSSFEDQREAERKRHVKAFNEASAKESGIFIENGYELIEKFLGSNKPN